MVESASREILWNLNTLPNVVSMYALFAAALLVAGNGLIRRVELWRMGKPAGLTPYSLPERIWQLLTWVVLQKGVLRNRSAAFMHTLIYVGFLTLLLTTTMVFVHHDLKIEIYQGRFYLLLTVLSDTLGFGVLIGCLIAAHRRYIAGADLVHNRLADGFALAVLALLIVQGFLLEALRIHATNDPWRYYSPVGLALAKFFWPLSTESAKMLHFGIWWFHTITVMAVIAIAPYTKFFHIIASSINLYFTDRKRAKGALKNPGDLEKLMEEQEEFSIGLGTIKDYSWKQLLDLDACTSCGRCQDVCPAYLSGKPLSPKWIILDTRNHLLSLQAKGTLNESGANSISAKMDQALLGGGYLASSGLRSDGSYTNGGRFRAENELVQSAALKIGESSEQRILGEVIAGEAFWSCTTCMACVEACPVGINHVDQIVGNRQNAALMHGEVPGEAQATLKKLEKQANPYGDPKDRCLWLAGLDLKILKPGDSVDYLYWVGCVSAYDQRKQKIAKALVRLMHAADLSFGVLGEMEGCSGDPARRLGEENLYQVMAKANIETLRSIKFKVLVANCPHCFNTIRNEYPQFGRISETEEVKIMHHSQLLRELLAQGKLKLKDVGEDLKVTMHDPCYLGRYNDEYEAPRQSLSKVKGLQIVEMERSREKAMCCGAGGGHYWMDLKIGERVNVLRTQQAQETGAGQIATACPFCMQMLEDGVNLAGLDGKMTVRDVAEVLADRI